jgi:outer membrane protein assembly factor BamB
MKKVFVVSVFALFSTGLFAYPGKVQSSFKTPGQFVTGMTYDGKYLWIADRKADKQFCVNPADGKVIRSVSSPAYWPMGLAFDGKYLWNADVKGGIPLAEITTV